MYQNKEMHPEVRKAHEAYEAQIAAWLSEIKAMDVESQNRPGPRNGFSPLQAIEHLALTDGMYIGFIKKVDRAKFAARKPKMNWIGRGMLRAMSAKPRPMMTVPSLTPPSNLVYGDVVAHWSARRAEMMALLGENTPDQGVFRHPLFGVLGPMEILQVSQGHLEYHIKRLKE